MTPIRLPDPFEPLRCLVPHRPEEPPPAEPRELRVRGQRYLLDGALLREAEEEDTLTLCGAVRTAIGRVVVQRPLLGRRGFDALWERALSGNGEQTYKLWRGLRHAQILGEVERREGSPLSPRRILSGGADEEEILRAAKAMLLGDLRLLEAAARAALPGGEWEPFQLARLLDSPSLAPAPPYSTGLIFSRFSPPA